MISNFFIRRPIVAMVIAIVTVLAGFISMRRLPLAQFPDIVPTRGPTLTGRMFTLLSLPTTATR